MVVGTLVALAGCGGESTAPAETAAPREPVEESAPAVADSPFTAEGVLEIRMEMRGNRNLNDPVGIHIEPGTTVRFINASGMHSSTAYHADNGRTTRIPPDAESWDSGLLTRRNESFEITLTAEGVYDYFCIPHETMGHVGRIIVGDPDAHPAQPTDGLPRAVIDALPPVDQIMADGIVRP